MFSRCLVVAVAILLAVIPGAAQSSLGDAASWASHLSNQYRVVPNITYQVSDNWESRIDLYVPRQAPGSTPVLMYIHGGGWVGGSKEGSSLRLAPWLEMGWAVVNVEYRLGQVARAPAAVEDCLCALRWVIASAEEYGFDTERIVVTGNSAGGHLALTTGILPASAGLDRQCPGDEELSVAAIINWYGITDVDDLLAGPNTRSYAVEWMGSQLDRQDIAARVSPLTYVRAGLPPVLTIHGDADPTVPYEHALRLQTALDEAGVPNRLHTVPGGRHGGFSRDETLAIFQTVRQFLGEHGLLAGRVTSQGQP